MTYVTSVSLPEHVEEDIKRDERDFSARVSEWADKYYVHGTPPVKGAMADEFLETLREAAEQQREAAEHIEAVIDLLDDAMDKEPDVRPETSTETYGLSDAKEWWRDQPWSLTLNPENPAIERWAERLSMTPAELCDQLSRVERRTKPDSLTAD